MRAPYRLVLLVLLGLLLAACSSGSGSDAPERPDESPEASAVAALEGTYVALGDSAASGMGIAPESRGDVCRRSARAYPPLLAARLGLDLENRTCAGARVDDLLDDSVVAALDAQTALVTVMVGANDLGYGGLIGVGCESGDQAGACSSAELRSEVDERLQRVTARLGRLVEVVGERAPAARVLVVGYADPLGDGPCPALPLTQAAFDLAASSVVELNAATRAAAEAADVEFVDTFEATRGHGVCDAEPWTNGVLTDGDGSAGHPRSDYHAAVVDLLADVLVDVPGGASG